MKYGIKLQEGTFDSFAEGEFPPGQWVTAGRYQGQFGVFLGFFSEIRCFIPESLLAQAVVELRADGDLIYAQAIENFMPDVANLRSGKEKIVRDLKGRKL